MLPTGQMIGVKVEAMTNVRQVIDVDQRGVAVETRFVDRQRRGEKHIVVTQLHEDRHVHLSSRPSRAFAPLWGIHFERGE